MNLKKTCIAIAVLNMSFVDEIQAATFRVNSTLDQVGVCTFEAALAKVNGDPNPGLANCNSINSAALGSNDQIIFSVSQITNISSSFSIKKSVKINPDGNTRIRFVGTGNSRIFRIGPEQQRDPLIEVTLDNVLITGGSSGLAHGGGVFALRTKLELSNSEVSSNRAATGGGVAINDSELTVKDSDITNNVSTASDIGAAGLLVRGVYSDFNASAVITNSKIDNNIGYSNSNAGGIGVLNAEITIKDSSVSNNTGSGVMSRLSKFDIDNADISNNTTLGSSIAISQGVHAYNSRGTIVNSRIEDNRSVVGGAGVYLYGVCDVDPCVTISNSKILGNTTVGGEGGGVAVLHGATLKIDSSTVSNNQSSRHGGGIFLNRDSKVEILNTTISLNRSVSGGGGGVAQSDSSEALLINSTVANNRANIRGGGLYREGSSGNPTLELLHSTVTANEVDTFEGGGIHFGTGDLTLSNSIVAGNQAGEITGIEVNGISVTTLGVNLLGTTQTTLSQALAGFTPSDSDITAVIGGTQPSSFSEIFADSALSDNGGTTLTYSLTQNSPAIDAADATECLRAGSIDQLETQRVSSSCDIGAVESPDSEENFLVIPIGNGKSVVVVL